MGKASEIWKEIKPKIGEMLVAVNDIETQAEKAQEEAYQKGVQDTKQHWVDAPRTCAYKLGYENGLNDAWDAARKISLNVDKGGLSANALTIIFCNKSVIRIFEEFSASEAIEKIRQYEQEKEEQIQLWNEVINGRNFKGTVTGIEDDGMLTIFCQDGTWIKSHARYWKKTGRHFPEIAEVLKKMREE